MNKISICNITLTSLQISGNQTNTGFLLGEKPYQLYVNGKPTDKVEGYKYLVVFPDNDYEKYEVKIKGDTPLITDEQIKQKGGQLKVTLKNLTGKIYRTGNGEYALSCSADGIEVIA